MGEPKATQLTFGSGIEALIKPLSPFVFQQLRSRANELFPDPDEQDYRQAPPEGVKLAIPGDLLPASQNSEYVRLLAEAAEKRDTWLILAVMTLACDFKQPQEELIAHFADQREALSQFIALPENVWEATLYHCILTSEVERQAVIAIAESKLPLTKEEVANGYSLFRLAVPLEELALLAATSPSRLKRGLLTKP